MIQVSYIFSLMKQYSLLSDDTGFHTTSSYAIPLVQQIQYLIGHNQKLVFVLPAFPAKSPNRNKTLGDLPDYGEVLALQNLQSLCDKITEVYQPGCELIICSDGRVFSDIVQVSDQKIDDYNNEIVSIIQEYGLKSIQVFRMDDIYPDYKPEELRNFLLDVYARDLDSIKNQVKSDESFRQLFNGVHRFLSEDEQALQPNLSRSAIERISKFKSYELIRRSEAWSVLLKDHFPNAVRLSIHPHGIQSEKFGIRLVPSSDKWATPWHNVVVKINDQYQLMHKAQALRQNAQLQWERGKYGYFEIATV